MSFVQAKIDKLWYLEPFAKSYMLFEKMDWAHITRQHPQFHGMGTAALIQVGH
jgi:hypothetical protein